MTENLGEVFWLFERRFTGKEFDWENVFGRPLFKILKTILKIK